VFDYGETRYVAFGEIDDALTVSFSRFATAGSAQSAFAKRTGKRSDAMAAKPKFDQERHEENPEWTKRDFANAKPASEILPPGVIAQFKNKGGRPRSENPKEAVKLRIDADVLAKFRKSGPGWQTRINGILRAAVSVHTSRAEAKAATRMTSKSASGKKGARPKTASKSLLSSEKRRHA
jgi:uncharacterized protein (DUF4415 family)